MRLSLIDSINISAILASQIGRCMSYKFDFLLCLVILLSTCVTGHSLEFDFIKTHAVVLGPLQSVNYHAEIIWEANSNERM